MLRFLMASLYDRWMYRSELECLGGWRRDLLADLEGRVLEIGPGTGANLGHYPATVTEVILAEPEAQMRRRLEARLAQSAVPGRILAAPAEALPLEDGSVATVVSTLVLCSVGDPERAVAELWRVLAPGGRLVFLEHVAGPPGSRSRWWQQRVEPAWRLFAGNCHLTRTTEDTLRTGGFALNGVAREPIRRVPWVVRPSIRGVAQKPA